MRMHVRTLCGASLISGHVRWIMPCACSATRLARRAEPQIHSLRVLARLSAVSSRVAPLVRRAVCVRRGKAARTRRGGRGGGHAPPGVLTRCGRRFWRVVKPGAVDRWSWSVGGGVVMTNVVQKFRLESACGWRCSPLGAASLRAVRPGRRSRRLAPCGIWKPTVIPNPVPAARGPARGAWYIGW